MSKITDETTFWMRRALQLARRQRGTFPNPRVGAIVVKDGERVGQGAHRQAGEPHAEVYALREAGAASRGADLYVTLEPCHHEGRTPPCSRMIAEAGVARVFVGVADPTTQARGGTDGLRKADVEVVSGICEDECRRLIEEFVAWQQERAYGVLKAAITLDGQIADAAGRSQWITGEKARQAGHRLRAAADLVMVGKGTLLADNPRLDVRGVRGPQPAKAVLCRRLPPLPADIALNPAKKPVHLICEQDSSSAKDWRAAGFRVERLPGWIQTPDILSRWMLGAGYHRFLLEGGGVVHRWALQAELIDRVHLFVAPLLLGGQGIGVMGSDMSPGLGQAFEIHRPQWHRHGADMEVTGIPVRRRANRPDHASSQTVS